MNVVNGLFEEEEEKSLSPVSVQFYTIRSIRFPASRVPRSSSITSKHVRRFCTDPPFDISIVNFRKATATLFLHHFFSRRIACCLLVKITRSPVWRTSGSDSQFSRPILFLKSPPRPNSPIPRDPPL